MRPGAPPSSAAPAPGHPRAHLQAEQQPDRLGLHIGQERRGDRPSVILFGKLRTPVGAAAPPRWARLPSATLPERVDCDTSRPTQPDGSFQGASSILCASSSFKNRLETAGRRFWYIQGESCRVHANRPWPKAFGLTTQFTPGTGFTAGRHQRLPRLPCIHTTGCASSRPACCPTVCRCSSPSVFACVHQRVHTHISTGMYRMASVHFGLDFFACRGGGVASAAMAYRASHRGHPIRASSSPSGMQRAGMCIYAQCVVAHKVPFPQCITHWQV